jgi:hypothetical protein
MAVAIKGVDYSHHGFTGAQLKAAGIVFACRYTVNFDSPGADFDKELKRAELVSLSDAGVRVVPNFEWAPNPPDSRATGKEHALANKAALARLGVPAWAMTYYSIDSNHTAGTRNNYARGWRDVYPADQLGSYTCGALGRQLLADGFITRWWQSMSRDFAGNHLPGTTTWDHRGAHIIQTGRGTLLNKDLDHDTATVADYGGFLLGEAGPSSPEDEVVTNAEMKGIATEVWEKLEGRSDRTMMLDVAQIRNMVIALQAQVAGLPQTAADPTALAAAVVAALGPDAQISQDELRDALVAAIVKLGQDATP